MEASSWLPLYGNLCCQLVAQPDCMTQGMMSGYLSQQQSVEGLQHCCRLYCVLKAGLLSCYFTPEEIQAKIEPSVIISINKDTRLRVVECNQKAGARLSIIDPGTGNPATHVFIAETPDLLQEWLSVLLQHIYDQSQWQHTCDKLMEIEVLSPPKPPLFLTKQADSVYNDLSIGSLWTSFNLAALESFASRRRFSHQLCSLGQSHRSNHKGHEKPYSHCINLL
ncbi:rhotekin-2 isoform X1 [Ictalurus punctatus]|uniref:Rhotekin-2 isoform X1 n=2 Tax=Ictalurus punctatus TaxID=7998 RepID=A0A2D0RM38_ICTPU|nr:rhotekin-2 isoform X1 [Ictalurus punctatus]